MGLTEARKGSDTMATIKEMGSTDKYGPCEVCKSKSGLSYMLVYHRFNEPGERHVFGCFKCLLEIAERNNINFWPCQQLLGGTGEAIYASIDGMCTHPECHPNNAPTLRGMKQKHPEGA